MPKKNTKAGTRERKVQIRIAISNDHFDALKSLENTSGLPSYTLAAVAFKSGMPLIQKRFAIDHESN